MTLYTPMAPGNHDDIEIEWHGVPREQGGYATAHPADGSMEAVHDALGRYERAVETAAAKVAEASQQETHEAPHGPVNTVPLGLRTIEIRGVQVTVDPTVFDAVAGDQAQELLDAVRDERGRVTATAATEMLVQIMSELAPKA